VNIEDIKVCIEYKPKESRVHSLVSTVGKSHLVANATGLDNVGVNIDTGHALMAFENLADSAVLCNYFNKLFYFHLNDNYREWDHDLILGSVHLWETFELFFTLQKIGYNGWYSLDIFPYREESIPVIQSNLNMVKRMIEISRNTDQALIAELQKKNDAVGVHNYLRELLLK
jgi:xylose isomerase